MQNVVIILINNWTFLATHKFSFFTFCLLMGNRKELVMFVSVLSLVFSMTTQCVVFDNNKVLAALTYGRNYAEKSTLNNLEQSSPITQQSYYNTNEASLKNSAWPSPYCSTTRKNIRSRMPTAWPMSRVSFGLRRIARSKFRRLGGLKRISNRSIKKWPRRATSLSRPCSNPGKMCVIFAQVEAQRIDSAGRREISKL